MEWVDWSQYPKCQTYSEIYSYFSSNWNNMAYQVQECHCLTTLLFLPLCLRISLKLARIATKAHSITNCWIQWPHWEVGWINVREILKILPSFNQSEYIGHYVIIFIIKFIMSHKHSITSKETQGDMEFWSLFIVHGRQKYSRLQSTPTHEKSTKSHNKTQSGFLSSS